jgi:hypothetical protein
MMILLRASAASYGLEFRSWCQRCPTACERWLLSEATACRSSAGVWLETASGGRFRLARCGVTDPVGCREVDGVHDRDRSAQGLSCKVLRRSRLCSSRRCLRLRSLPHGIRRFLGNKERRARRLRAGIYCELIRKSDRPSTPLQLDPTHHAFEGGHPQPPGAARRRGHAIIGILGPSRPHGRCSSASSARNRTSRGRLTCAAASIRTTSSRIGHQAPAPRARVCAFAAVPSASPTPRRLSR